MMKRSNPPQGKFAMHLPRFAPSRLVLTAALAAATAGAWAQSTEPVRVGLLSTLSGPGAGLGVDIRDGFQLAVKLNGGKLGGPHCRGRRGR